MKLDKLNIFIKFQGILEESVCFKFQGYSIYIQVSLDSADFVMVWHGLELFSMVLHSLAWFGLVWHCLAWFGMVWYGLA